MKIFNKKYCNKTIKFLTRYELPFNLSEYHIMEI